MTKSEHYRKSAEEARTIADQMQDQSCIKAMQEIAEYYDLQAENEEKRTRHPSQVEIGLNP